MAQPAGLLAYDNRTEMAIPVFWTTANLDPPRQIKMWLEQFLMAVTVKENINPEIMLEEPKDKRHSGKTTSKTRNTTRNCENSQKLRTKREEHVSQGLVTICTITRYRRSFRLLLSLGTEGKKRLLQKNPHVEISKMSFKEISELASTSFQKVKCVTFEKYKLSTRMQEPGETLEALQAEITAQAARSEIENEIVRDLFISKMKNRALQDTPTFETLEPEQVPKRVTKFERSKLTTMAF